jgi:alkylated DNA repair protein (DNA oxidative demethylase)
MRLALELAPGLRLFKDYFSPEAQRALLDVLRAQLAQSPMFTPRMPRTAKPFSVRMSNCGPLGWVSDVNGYRYQATHPETGEPWPPIPDILLDCWADVAHYPHLPEACLINWYDPAARMGLHQDKDEQDVDAPVLSVSLGDSCVFRFGRGTARSPTQSVTLASGDVVIIGGASRLCFHGVDRIKPGTSTLLSRAGRINLTLRRVTKP